MNQSQCFTSNQNSILKILPTDYSYKDYSVFKIAVPSESYRGFPNSGYFAVQNKAFYYLNIDERCSENYKNGQYTINKPQKSLESEPNLCDIDFRFFFSTDAKTNDTISHIAKEWDWIILKSKFFDPIIKDTAYIFEKKIRFRSLYGFFVFLFTRVYGFIHPKI